jgi:integrase
MEFRSVLANLSEHWRDYVEFFYLCGMRPKEIRSLSWPDVDAGCIRLRAENAKTGHSRSIALTGQTADLIARRRLQMSPNTSLIFHYKGQPMGDHRKAWKTACGWRAVRGSCFTICTELSAGMESVGSLLTCLFSAEKWCALRDSNSRPSGS